MSLTQPLPSPSRDVLKALIIGEQDTIPDDIREQFSRLGLSHLLSISGLHVSMFALLSYFVLMSLFRAVSPDAAVCQCFQAGGLFLHIPGAPVLLYCRV